MPGKFLHAGCTMKCPVCMADIKVPQPKNQVYTEREFQVLVENDQFSAPMGAATCFGPQFGSSACGICAAPTILNWLQACEFTVINDNRALLQTSVGFFTDFSGKLSKVLIQDSAPPTVGEEG